MLRSKQFGNYEIIRKLGRGMTDVYLAFDTVHNRHAVLKIVEESPDSLTRIIMEAERRGAALQKQLHEFDSRVIEIFEYGDLEGCFFIAMQYIEGRNIAEILSEEKRLDPVRASKLAIEICSQLDRLHSFTADIDGQRRAIVHGDIKPSNIQAGLNDEVRLLDFGIAKAITFTHNLTHHNFGTPSYCSPERLSKAQVDSHADLWAVGVTLFEMITGTPPYQAQSTRKLEGLIVSRRPPRALPEDCPTGLKAILNKALAGDLHQRYVSAAAFRDDLQLFLQNRPTIAEKETRVGWITNETLEKPKPQSSDPTTVDKRGPALPAGRKWPWPPHFDARRIASALSLLGALLWGLFAGLLIFGSAGYFYRIWHQSAPLRTNLDHTRRSPIEINADWDLYRRLSQHTQWLGRWSPVTTVSPALRQSYLAAADDVIDRYHNSSSTSIQDFDWRKAALCLQHALDMDGHDNHARGKLALCNGYIALTQSSNVVAARQQFEEAVSLLPKSPDPHLGLARIWVYALHNIGKAVAELHEAQRFGYQLGPREMEEEADGYRYRALQELAQHRMQLAQRDFDRARQLYEPIMGYSNVSSSLRQMEAESEVKAAAPVKRRVAWRGRRWQ